MLINYMMITMIAMNTQKIISSVKFDKFFMILFKQLRLFKKWITL